MEIMRFRNILLLLIVFINTNIFATDIIGGSLRYEALGKEKYKLIGTINRDCAGEPLDIFYFRIFSKDLDLNLIATRVAIKDITNYCKGKSTPCSPQNTKNGNGQEQHVFETIIDFSKAPYSDFYKQNNCEVNFAMEACCRTNKITTMSTAGNLYLVAMLNLCNLGKDGENSTSTIAPNTYNELCINIPFTYNFGYFEKDLDSLLHTLETPIRGIGFDERYISPFSARYPLTPFCSTPGVINCTPLPNAKPPRGLYFVPNTGDIMVTPIVGGEKALIKIKTSEFRLIDGIIKNVGYSTMEIFVKMVNCSDNIPPIILANESYGVCEGDKLCFTIKSMDQRSINATIDDTTFMDWNKGIPGTNCTWQIKDSTAREKSALFCWQTQLGDSKPYEYQFSVNATDSNCNMPLGTTRSFVINVKPRAKVSRQYIKMAGNKLCFNVPDTIKGGYGFDWSIRDSANAGTRLYRSYNRNDSFTFADTGKYYIALVVNAFSLNCPTTYLDTVYMDGSITPPPLSIGKFNFLNAHIYPNPATQSITIELPPNHGISHMKVWSSDGRLIYSGAYTNTLNISAYSKGVYMLELIGEEQHQFLKVIKS